MVGIAVTLEKELSNLNLFHTRIGMYITTCMHTIMVHRIVLYSGHGSRT